MCNDKIHKFGVSLASFAVVFGLSLSGVAPAMAQTNLGYSHSISSSESESKEVFSDSGIDYEETKEKIAQDFEFLFTQVIVQDSSGKWFVKDPENPSLAGLTQHDIDLLITMLNDQTLSIAPTPSSSYSLQRGASTSAIIKDWNKYATCVIEGATGFKVSPTLVVSTVFLIKEGRWHDAATTLMRGLAENAASGLLDMATQIAVKQLTNSVPGVFAARLAVNASLCVMYNQ